MAGNASVLPDHVVLHAAAEFALEGAFFATVGGRDVVVEFLFGVEGRRAFLALVCVGKGGRGTIGVDS